MKIAFSAIAVAALAGLAFYLAGSPLQLPHYVVILFATSILVWTFEQYNEHNDDKNHQQH